MAEIIQFPAKLPSPEPEHIHIRPRVTSDERFCCDSCQGFPKTGDSPLWDKSPLRCRFGQQMSFAMPVDCPESEDYGYFPTFGRCPVFKGKEERECQQ